MKIRVLLLSVACALAVSPLARADETELGGKMEKMSGAFRAIRRQITDKS
jgi:soluble cytochrome b562